MSNLNQRVVVAAIHAAAQQPLPLGDRPDDDASLRAAFNRSGLADQGWTYERAVLCDSILKCLINSNIARLRARTGRHG